MDLRMSCDQLNFSYEKKNILHEVSLHIEPGCLYSIVGPNGVGKSTLLKCLANIYPPDSGAVYLDGHSLASLDQKKLATVLGYVPQNPTSGFAISVYEMVLLGRRPYIQWRVRKEDEEVVESILHRLGITDLAQRPVNTLSGGERQKVAIARALAQNPKIIFLDEPTSNLDINHQLEVMELLEELVRVDHTSVVVVLHDLNLAIRYSDQVILMGIEKIYAVGQPEEVLTVERIKTVYGVSVQILDTPYGHYVIPVRTEGVI